MICSAVSFSWHWLRRPVGCFPIMKSALFKLLYPILSLLFVSWSFLFVPLLLVISTWMQCRCHPFVVLSQYSCRLLPFFSFFLGFREYDIFPWLGIFELANKSSQSRSWCFLAVHILHTSNNITENLVGHRCKQKQSAHYTAESSLGTRAHCGTEDDLKHNLFYPCLDRMINELDNRCSGVVEKILRWQNKQMRLKENWKKKPKMCHAHAVMDQICLRGISRVNGITVYVGLLAKVSIAVLFLPLGPTSIDRLSGQRLRWTERNVR